MAPHTLVVEGNKVIEKSASGEVIKTSVRPLPALTLHPLARLGWPPTLGRSWKWHLTASVRSRQDYDHVIRGYKATLGRENVSDEAKSVRGRPALRGPSILSCIVALIHLLVLAIQEARQLLHDLQKAHKPFEEEAGEAEEAKHASGHQRRKSVSKHVHPDETSEEHKHGEPRPHRYEESGDEVPLPHEGETHDEMVHRHR